MMVYKLLKNEECESIAPYAFFLFVLTWTLCKQVWMFIHNFVTQILILTVIKCLISHTKQLLERKENYEKLINIDKSK